MTTLTPYVAIDGTEITSYLRDGAPRPVKPSKKIKDEPIMGTNRAVLWNEGRKALGYEMVCSFLPSQYATYDTVTQKFDDLEDGDLFYPRSDRFAVCQFGNSDPLQSQKAADGVMLRLEGQIWSEAAELYDATPSTWSPTDEILPITQDTGESNGGNIAAPLYSLTLTARASGSGLKGAGGGEYVDAGVIDFSAKTAISIEFRVNTDGYAYFRHGNMEANGEFQVFLFENYLKTNTRASGATEEHSFGAVADGWHDIVVTINKTGNEIIAYVDGVKLGDTYIRDPALPAFSSTSYFYFGAYTEGTTETFAAFRLWSRVLSAAEALACFNSTTVSDTSLEIEWDFCEGSGAILYDLSGNSKNAELKSFTSVVAGYGDTHDTGWLTSIGPVSPALELLDGATEVDSLTLTSHLMTAEVLAQDRFGTTITQTYVDDFTADVGRPAFGNGYFWADGYCYAKYIDAEIVLTSKISGLVGEEISITITDTDQAVLSVSVSGYDITVDLDTSGGNPISTAQEVIDAINADGDASALVTASLASGEDGTTVLGTQAKTQLALNVAVTGGALVIEDDREAEYHLVGTRPIKAGGLVVTFTPTISGTGTVGLDASQDQGATWETVIDNTSTQWTDGIEMEITIPDTIAKGETEIWIRFTCDALATSLSIDDLIIYQERDVSDSEVPKIPVGETYKVQIGGAGWGDAATVWRDRYKP